jgi:predicted nucleic acid-binding protein
MNIYVETNFVLELAFVQDEHESCERILESCEAGQAMLALPAFCLAESYETLIRRRKKRRRIRDDLDTELRELGRSGPYKQEIGAFRSVVGLLARSEEEEERRLIDVLERVSRIAKLIPLEADVLSGVTPCRAKYSLTPQDSIVYLSVLRHLTSEGGRDSCFVNRNRKDFDDPDIEESLANRGCKMLFSFTRALHYLEYRRSPGSSASAYDGSS